MSDFFRQIVRNMNDDTTYVADDCLHSSEYTGCINTGSYILNALLSGSIHGGIANNKITAFAGESATGKTFFALGLIHRFLHDNQSGGVVYYDTETAVTRQMMLDRGIDTQRVIIVEKNTVEEFRTHVSKLLDQYVETPKNSRPPMLLVLDSLGQLSTKKEVGDINEGKDARDMTRAQLIRGTFRALSLKLAKARCPMIITNHVSDAIGAYVPTKVMGGGGGLKYAASQIVFLSARNEREGTDVIGKIIHCKLEKSRFTRERKIVDVKLTYDHGLDRYYGLADLAVKYGIFKKTGSRLELPDGTKLFEKSVMREPEKHFTEQVLNLIEAAVSTEFKYGLVGHSQEVESEQENGNVQEVMDADTTENE